MFINIIHKQYISKAIIAFVCMLTMTVSLSVFAEQTTNTEEFSFEENNVNSINASSSHAYTVSPSHVYLSANGENVDGGMWQNFIVTNTGTEPLTIHSLSNPESLQIGSMASSCSGVTLQPSQACAYTVYVVNVFEPNNILQVNTSDPHTPAYAIRIMQVENPYEQAQRRVPPVFSNMEIIDSAGKKLIGRMIPGETYTFNFTLEGYHPIYNALVSLFECDTSFSSDCAASSNSSIAYKSTSESTVGLSDLAYEATIVQADNKTVKAQAFTYSIDLTMPEFDENNAIVLRFYYKSQLDRNASNRWISILGGGGQGLTFVDQVGRKIIISQP